MGIMLSGGVDSSIITALAARTAPGIDKFSVGFDSAQHDESQYAAEVARLVGCRAPPSRLSGKALPVANPGRRRIDGQAHR